VNDRTDDRLLRYLEGRATAEEREEVERELAVSPTLKSELEDARRGLEAIRGLARSPGAAVPPLADAARATISAQRDAARRADRRRMFRRAATIAAFLLLPAGGWFARGLMAPPLATLPGPSPESVAPPATLPNPQLRPYFLLFEGVWPDRERLEPPDEMQRTEAYMSWFDGLEAQGRLVTGYELGGAPGVLLARGPLGGVTETTPDTPPSESLVGFIVIRASSEEEARRIAAESPHLRYGGSVLVKAAGGG